MSLLEAFPAAAACDYVPVNKEGEGNATFFGMMRARGLIWMKT